MYIVAHITNNKVVNLSVSETFPPPFSPADVGCDLFIDATGAYVGIDFDYDPQTGNFIDNRPLE